MNLTLPIQAGDWRQQTIWWNYIFSVLLESAWPAGARWPAAVSGDVKNRPGFQWQVSILLGLQSLQGSCLLSSECQICMVWVLSSLVGIWKNVWPSPRDVIAAYDMQMQISLSHLLLIGAKVFQVPACRHWLCCSVAFTCLWCQSLPESL